MQTRRSNYQTPVATEVAYPSDLTVTDQIARVPEVEVKTTGSASSRPGRRVTSALQLRHASLAVSVEYHDGRDRPGNDSDVRERLLREPPPHEPEIGALSPKAFPGGAEGGVFPWRPTLPPAASAAPICYPVQADDTHAKLRQLSSCISRTKFLHP